MARISIASCSRATGPSSVSYSTVTSVLWVQAVGSTTELTASSGERPSAESVAIIEWMTP